MGISNTVVTPPAAAAWVSVMKVPRSGWPGARTWKWMSMAPGMTRQPSATISRRAAGSAPG